MVQIFKFIFKVKEEWEAWKNPAKRQYKVVERYRVPVPEENRVDYLVVIMYKNPDGTHGFWKELYIPYPNEKNISADLQVRYDYGDPSRVIIPGYFKNEAACNSHFSPWNYDVRQECAITYTGVTPEPFVNLAKTGNLKNVVTKPDGTTFIDVPLSTQSDYHLPDQFNP